jgi:hypothetical protein
MSFEADRTDVLSRSLASHQLDLPLNDAFPRHVDLDRAAGLSLTSIALLRCLVTPLCLLGNIKRHSRVSAVPTHCPASFYDQNKPQARQRYDTTCSRRGNIAFSGY